MECFRCLAFASSVLFLQVFTAGLCEDDLPCQPGFTADHFVFRVHRTPLHVGQRLGKVSIDDCTGRQRAMFKSDDSRFHVDFDGTVRLKRVVNLHDGHKSFSVHAWVSDGVKVTARVTVQHDPRGRHHHVARVSLGQLETTPSLPVIQFPHSSGGLVRRKREWLIPPIRMSENVRGPFPLKVVEIKSSLSKEFTVEYAISGPGADQPPVGLFTVGKSSGVLFVNQPLDREKQSTYTLQAICTTTDRSIRENPIEIIIEVLDQNDNAPIFTQDSFMGFVPEAAKEGFEIVTVSATDADDPNMDNSMVWYSILSQDPPVPNGGMFAINYLTGVIRLTGTGLDKEKNPEYTLVVQATDNAGKGTQVTCKAFIKVTDSNDNAPRFTKSLYTANVPENVVGYEVVKMQVTDDDDPHTPAWFTKFRIIQGNIGGFFNVSTGPSKLEGIITTVKALDFEVSRKYTLLVVVENDAPFDIPVLTSTATVEVTVKDVNEAPIFNPVMKVIVIEENLAQGEALTTYTATDPDTDQKQTMWYRMGSDPAGWLNIQRDSGLVSVKSQMDRESPFVLDGKYQALILAIDNDTVPATGTGTLLIELTDVNDNAPTIDQRVINVCNEDPQPVLLSITDPDGPGFNAPFRVELRDQSQKNWTARMNASKTGIELLLKTKLPQGDYDVVLRVFDTLSNAQESTLHAKVCDCRGDEFQCINRIASMDLPGIVGILAAIMLLLLLVLLLLMFLRRRNKVKKDPLLPEDDVRDNIYYYDEEGGGEEDQDYDLSQLHRGLDNRPDVFRNDVAPTFMPAPQYRPRPANPEDIGNFIDDNLKAADNDPTAPPYDSLLVFDYEGGGSEAGSLSSLNSSSSGGDQDYDCLNEWGPRFKKLADMYGGGED